MIDSLYAFNAQNFHWWQLISAHLVHYDAKHLILNLLALPLLVFVFAPKFKQLVLGFLMAIVLIDVYLLGFQIKIYMGFSGLLYVIPGLAAGRYLRNKQWLPFTLIISSLYLFVFILSTEQHIIKSITWHTLKQAHLLGFLSGVFVNTQIRQFVIKFYPN